MKHEFFLRFTVPFKHTNTGQFLALWRQKVGFWKQIFKKNVQGWHSWHPLRDGATRPFRIYHQ